MKLPLWKHRDADLEQEINTHLAMAQRDLQERGASPAAAEAAARRQFGNALLVKEVTREMWGWTSLERLWQDIRYGVRLLRKSPGFSIIAIVTLALGIGANTALFSVVNGVLLNPLPYARPDRLIAVYESKPHFEKGSFSYLNFLDIQQQNRTLESIAAFRESGYSLTGSGTPEMLRAEMISADLFRILGIAPVAGRDFTRDEDRLGATPVAILGLELWKKKFGGSSQIIGKPIDLEGKPYVVVGVMPGQVELTGNFRKTTDIYLLMGQDATPNFRDRSASWGTDAIGRLREGVTVEQARDDLGTLAANLSTTYPKDNRGIGITLLSLKEDMIGDVRPALLVLLGAVGFVLLIACGNVANLLLARSVSRQREIAVRAALGASATRIVRQLLTESLLLAFAGGTAGLLLAAWGTSAAKGLLPAGSLPRTGNIAVDARVLAFTFAIAVLAGVVFGLVPALKSTRFDLYSTLKEGGRGASGSRHRAQAIFVVLETAMALVLLAGAGLMIRSLVSLWRVNPGFNPHDVVLLGINLPPSTNRSNPAAVRAAIRALDEAVRQVPGIQSEGFSAGAVPLQSDDEASFWLEGEPKPSNANDFHMTVTYLVQPGYFTAMQVPLLRGRPLTEQDNETGLKVAVIDEAFAERYFPHQDPIGKHLSLVSWHEDVEIVGVAGHVKQFGLDTDSAGITLRSEVYLPIMQASDEFLSILNELDVFARGPLPPMVMQEQVRQVVQKVNRDGVVFGAKSMDSLIERQLAMRRFSMILLATFAGLALVLACIGLYGVISYAVGQRTQEIGVRMALGARRGDVLRMVLRQGAALAAIGVAIGIAAALVLTRFMSSMLYGVRAVDPVTFGSVALLLSLLAMVACYVPARRAMRIDPMTALRRE